MSALYETEMADNADQVAIDVNASPQDFFGFIDQQHSSLISQLEHCELQRKEIVREMAEHVLSFHSHPSVFQRHVDLATQLPGLQKEHEQLSKQLASVQLLAKKRQDIEHLMMKRLNVVNSGGRLNFSVDELRQIIENEACANIQVEILIKERNSWKLQLKQAKKDIVQLQLECSAKNERITLLQRKIEYLQQQELGGHHQSESMSVSSDALRLIESSFLPSNPDLEKSPSTRNNKGNLQFSGSPLSIPNFSHDYKKSTAAPPQSAHQHSQHSATTRRVNMLKHHLPIPDTSGYKNNVCPVVMVADHDAIRKEQEKSLRCRVQEEFAKMEAEEARIRIQQQERQAAQAAATDQMTSTPFLDMSGYKKDVDPVIMVADHDAIRKEQEKSLRSRLQEEAAKKEAEETRRIQQEGQTATDHMMSRPSLDTSGYKNEVNPVVMIANRDAIRSRAQDEAVKAEAEETRRIQQEGQTATDQMMSRPSLDDRSEGISGQQLVSRSSNASLASFGSTNQQHQRPGATRTPPLSPSSSKRSALTLKESSSMGGEVARSPLSALPGALRMSADGELLEETERADDDEDDGAVATTTPDSSNTFTITATLVREQSENNINSSSDREHSFERRERELQAREAEIAKQTQRLRGDIAPTAEVAAVRGPAVATAVARISRRGSIRELGRGLSSLSDASASVSHVEENSSLTIGTIGEDITDLEAGPLRFHASTERSMRSQLRELSDKDYECFRTLQSRWENKRKDKGGAPYSDDIILRFLRNNCRKEGSFSLRKAWKAIKHCKERNLFLSASKLQKQLLTATLFPIPGLLSHAGLEMFYMKPSRYHRKDSICDVIDNLVYVMNCMLEKERNSRNGIGFLACMNDWKMVNFDTTYCYRFMMALQATVVPVAVELFLIVNPPSWFGKIWKIMRPMLAPSFRKKVKVIKESMLDIYLMEGYREHLPDDLSTGTVNTFQLAQDFVTYRKHIERGNVQLNAKSATMEEETVSPAVSKHSFTNWIGLHRSLDSSHRTFSDMENLGSSVYDGYSSNDIENDDDDASIHCSIDGEEEGSQATLDA